MLRTVYDVNLTAAIAVIAVPCCPTMPRFSVRRLLVTLIFVSLTLVLFFSAHILLYGQHHAQLVTLQRQHQRTTITTTTNSNSCRYNMISNCTSSITSSSSSGTRGNVDLVRYWSVVADCFPPAPPLKLAKGGSKFVAFQPDLGGWNNIRMALEVVILFALVTQRVLVLPPDSVLYLLSKNKKWGDNFSNMDDYFNFDHLRDQGKGGGGIRTMSMPEFLDLIRQDPSYWLEHYNSSTTLPSRDATKQPLWAFLENTCYWRQWQPGKTFLTFGPYIPGWNETSRYRRHSMNYKRIAVPYETTFADKPVVYFAGHDRNRMLTLFYGYLYMAKDSLDLKVKRFVRDRMRYHDAIFCLGSKIVSLLPSNYVAFHIRRGDFQHKHTQLAAEQILKNVLGLVPKGINDAYISTDEKDKTFFAPFFRRFGNVYFLSNFTKEVGLGSIDQNYLGMIEQVVCASAHTFFGTPLSTFTGYISRIRGYKNTTSATRGIYSRTYYFMPKHIHQLHEKPNLALPFWPREFVQAFEGLT